MLCSRHAWKHHLRHSRCGLLLAAAWILGLAVGCAPPVLLRHTQEKFRDKCEFMTVVDFRFLVTFIVRRALKTHRAQVYVIFYGTIITPTVIILLCYLSIYLKIKSDSARLRRNLSLVEMERRCEFICSSLINRITIPEQSKGTRLFAVCLQLYSRFSHAGILCTLSTQSSTTCLTQSTGESFSQQYASRTVALLSIQSSTLLDYRRSGNDVFV